MSKEILLDAQDVAAEIEASIPAEAHAWYASKVAESIKAPAATEASTLINADHLTIEEILERKADLLDSEFSSFAHKKKFAAFFATTDRLLLEHEIFKHFITALSAQKAEEQSEQAFEGQTRSKTSHYLADFDKQYGRYEKLIGKVVELRSKLMTVVQADGQRSYSSSLDDLTLQKCLAEFYTVAETGKANEMFDQLPPLIDKMHADDSSDKDGFCQTRLYCMTKLLTEIHNSFQDVHDETKNFPGLINALKIEKDTPPSGHSASIIAYDADLFQKRSPRLSTTAAPKKSGAGHAKAVVDNRGNDESIPTRFS